MHDAIRVLAVVATALTVATTSAHAQAAVAVGGVAECGPGTAIPDCANAPLVRSRLFDGIELTAAQQAAVDSITLRYRALNAALHRENLPVDAHNAQFKALRAREIADKRKVMTPAQHPRFDANADSLRMRDEQLREEARRRAAEREKQGGRTARP